MKLVLQDKIEKSFPLFRIEGNEVQKTLYFKIGKVDVKPGQFYMLNFQVAQKPFSVSYYDQEIIGFTIEDRGSCSKKMINACVGQYFGLTGPLGSSFEMKNVKNALVMGGGIGCAPLLFLANHMNKKKIKMDLLFGARSLDYIEYALDLDKQIKCNMLNIYTDDGSSGIQGVVTKDLVGFLKYSIYDCLYMCGPEKMMQKVIRMVGDKIPVIQISMERYMKCGLGLCGSCVLDEIGLRVCEEGPVFNYHETLMHSKEFTHYHRDSNGVVKQL